MAFQREGSRVKRRERRKEPALLRESPCGLDRECRLAEQAEPARARQRHQGLPGALGLDKFRWVHDPHEQARAGRGGGYPGDIAPYGQRAGGESPGPSGFGQRRRTRKAARKARERVGDGGQPGIGLFREFRRMDLGQRGCGQAFQKGARQSLGDQAQRRAIVIALFVGCDTRQQRARFAAQQMLRRRPLHALAGFDQKQIDRTPINEPDAVRIVESHRLVAGAGHGCADAGGKLRQRLAFRPRVVHQTDLISL